MFLTSKRRYTASGEQRAAGRFLMVFSRTKERGLRVLVRRAEMHQAGHWMMGTIIVNSDAAKAENDTVSKFDKEAHPHFYRVGDGHFRISLSGTYGCDGLPITAEYYPGLWELLHVLPEELSEKGWGGHNEAGPEALSVHEWATARVTGLMKLVKPKER